MTSPISSSLMWPLGTRNRDCLGCTPPRSGIHDIRSESSRSSSPKVACTTKLNLSVSRYGLKAKSRWCISHNGLSGLWLGANSRLAQVAWAKKWSKGKRKGRWASGNNSLTRASADGGNDEKDWELEREFEREKELERGPKGRAGDPEVQQMLVDMLQVQILSVHIADVVEQHSEAMRSIARESLKDLERIASKTMKGMDHLSDRVMRELDAEAHAIQKNLETARREMEARERDLEKCEERMWHARNEGVFFKTPYIPKPLPPAHHPSGQKMNAALNDASKGNVRSGRGAGEGGGAYRSLLCAALSIAIVSFLWSTSSAFLSGGFIQAPKLAAYGGIFSLLLFQIKYEKMITGEDEGGDDAF